MRGGHIGAVVLACMLAPGGARADAIGAASACPPGTSRSVGLPDRLAGGLFAHGGPPPCEPAVCTTAGVCGDSQACRLDAHCIARGEVREMRRRPDARRGPLDPRDPASWTTVTRTYDLGRCEGGGCPEGARCLQVATCRAAGEVDSTPLARAPPAGREVVAGAPIAERAWTAATPYEPAPASPAAPPEARPLALEEPTTPSPAPRAPPAPDAGCAIGPRARSGAAIILAVICALLALRARREPGRGR